MSKRKTAYTHPTLMSTADHAALMAKLAERQERCAAPAHYRGPDTPPAYRTVKTLDGPAPSFCECGRNWDDCSTRDDADPDAQHADRGLQAETPHRGIVGY